LISVLVVMTLIQISRLELLEYHLLSYWPVIIVLIGLNILLKPKRVIVEEVEAENVSRTIENTFDLHVVFNSVEKIVQSTEFVGGSVNTVFGSTKIDLVGATPSSGDMVLKLSVVFGEIVIRVPTGWNVSLNVTPVFGAAEDIRSPFIATYQANAPMLHISGSAVLGAVKLKN
jgi:predicted membrane protein